MIVVAEVAKLLAVILVNVAIKIVVVKAVTIPHASIIATNADVFAATVIHVEDLFAMMTSDSV
ncbi:hypothetical protein [Sporosarcina sp. ITBMC105]